MHFLLKDELPLPYRRSLNISRNRLNDGGIPRRSSLPFLLAAGEPGKNPCGLLSPTIGAFQKGTPFIHLLDLFKNLVAFPATILIDRLLSPFSFQPPLLDRPFASGSETISDALADFFHEGRENINVIIRPVSHIHEAVLLPKHDPPQS